MYIENAMFAKSIHFDIPSCAFLSACTNPNHVPIGDGKISTTGPKTGYVYMARVPRGGHEGGPGAFREGEWMNADGTFDLSKKVSVVGSVSCPIT